MSITNFYITLPLEIDPADSLSTFPTHSHTFLADKSGAFVAFPHIQIIQYFCLNIFTAILLSIRIALNLLLNITTPIFVWLFLVCVLYCKIFHQCVIIIIVFLVAVEYINLFLALYPHAFFRNTLRILLQLFRSCDTLFEKEKLMLFCFCCGVWGNI